MKHANGECNNYRSFVEKLSLSEREQRHVKNNSEDKYHLRPAGSDTNGDLLHDIIKFDDQNITDTRPVRHHHDQIFSNHEDKISLHTSNEKNKPSANYAANEPLITDTFDVSSDIEKSSDVARLADYRYDGEIVCTLLVPRNISDSIVPPDTSSCLTTPDSDRDSGCFSEDHSSSSLITANCQNNTPVTDLNRVETKQKEAAVCKPKRGKSSEFAKSIYKLQNPRPFQRKIWKRRNGWFRVRNSDAGVVSDIICSSVNCGQAQADTSDTSVRSQLSEKLTAGQPQQQPASLVQPEMENFKFLLQQRARDTSDTGDCVAAKECEAVKEIQKITFKHKLSDNDQELEIFPDTSDTIKANGDRESVSAAAAAAVSQLTSPAGGQSGAAGGSSLTQLQLQLAQMRLEIAQMVAEASILEESEPEDSYLHLDSSDEQSIVSEISDDDISFNEHYEN